LEFENVAFIPAENNGKFNTYNYIGFEINQDTFEMMLDRKNNRWVPQAIFHRCKLPHECDFCGFLFNTNICTELTRKKMELYEQLKNHPNVRLYLLYEY
jgi:hypothetical protein